MRSKRTLPLLLAGLVLAFVSTPAFAQAGTSSIRGTVVDASGGVLPGATVTVENDRTGATFMAVTGARGGFTVPSVPVGIYTVTVTLDGFKTAVLGDVDVSGGQPAIVNAKLEVGALTETVNVEAAGALVQTQSSTVSNRINVDEIMNLPLTSRNALEFVINLPGVSTPGGSRSSQINGLDQSANTITIDGVSSMDNHNKTTDGFFSRVSPRLDAIEEVTVNSAASGANASGAGAVQINFVTRSGSNTYTGSVYHYYRNDALNANTFFNIRDEVDKVDLLQNQPGFRIGGPIVIPGLFDGHNRAFFFVNYEEFRQPSEVTRSRTLLTPEAQRGLFTYETGGGSTNTVDLLALAAAGGHVSTLDPLMAQLLADIRSSTNGTGSIIEHSDPTLDRFRYNVATKSLTRRPTVRIDWNLSENHRISGSANWQYYGFFPDTLNSVEPGFPGFPVQGGQGGTRMVISTSLRSTLGPNVVNELRVGGSGGPTQFFPELNASMWSNPDFGYMGGFHHDIDTANISNPALRNGTSQRNAYTMLIENTVNWQLGDHGLNFGGVYEQVNNWRLNQDFVPELDYDVVTGTPADSMFVSANFPGSSSADRGNAEDLYAVLVGSVSQFDTEVRIDPNGNYVHLGASLEEGHIGDFAFWIQDAWRPRPDLTINLGLRYELQTPFYSRNDSYAYPRMEDVWGISGVNPSCDFSRIRPGECNIYDPTASGGKPISEFHLLSRGTQLYAVDKNNFAPSVGIAWTPSSEGTGWVSRFLGQPGDTVLRAGWSRSFQRPGMGEILGRLDDNPGLISQEGDRNDSRGNLLNGADVLLLRTPELLTPAPFPLTREFPLTDSETSDIAIFDPNLEVPWADTWSVGWQRSMTRNMAVEVRYVGTRGRDLWFNQNINGAGGINVIENGLADEFRLAQQNLQANLAAGRGGTFAYFGPGTGTSPLPISLAYFNGRVDAGNAAAYTSSNFRSSTFVNDLALYEPDLFSFATDLDSSSSRRRNALRAGLPANFLVPNPNKLGGAEILGNLGTTDYHSLQVELRRRMANGLQLQGSYTLGRGYQDDFYSFRVPIERSLDHGGEGSVTHALKANWLFELPIGQGRRFGTNMGPVMDRIFGGWQIHGVARFQSGEILEYQGVDLVGMSIEEFKDLHGVYVDGVKNGSLSTYTNGVITFLPDDVILNTRRAFNTSATSPTGYSSLGVPEGRYIAPAGDPDCFETIAQTYGDCGERVVELDGPWFKNVDLSIVKLIPIQGRVRAEVRFEMLNAFNWVNFNPFATTSTSATAWEATSFIGTSARIVQIVSRVTW
ncbi:MAG TPA: carboxypeptidase regulatory-like domain-containing protein [Vicinamibacterales bacterium]|nr:carboxypeptidase regulatory-like domain-containing protein [Vicinamibacterales bacterium]